MLRSSFIAALALALGTAGCAGTTASSQSKFKGDQAAVAKVFDKLQSSSQPGRSDASTVCNDLLTPALQQQMGSHGKSCKDAVNDAVRNADAYELTVTGVKVNGTQATATVKVETGKKDQVQTVSLVKQGGAWRIARLP